MKRRAAPKSRIGMSGYPSYGICALVCMCDLLARQICEPVLTVTVFVYGVYQDRLWGLRTMQHAQFNLDEYFKYSIISKMIKRKKKRQDLLFLLLPHNASTCFCLYI